MNMYEAFETDGALETAGVWFDYGSFRILCAHAGNGNKKYLKLRSFYQPALKKKSKARYRIW